MQEQSSLKKKTISGLFWSSSDLIANQGIRFIIQIVLARLLLPEDFGLLGMALVFTVLVAIFNDMGIGSAIVQKQIGWYDQ